jgi:hypothetical protein
LPRVQFIPSRSALASPLLTVLLLACGTTPGTEDAARSDAGARDASGADAWVPATPTTTIAAENAVAPEHPAYDGQQRFLHDAWGAERLDRWPPADFMVALATREPDVFGDQFASFGFVADPDDDLPVGLKRGLDDPTRVHETCALCHVGRLPDGGLWLGAPNLELDLMRFRAEVDLRWVADGHPSLLTDLDRAKASAYGPGRVPAELPFSPIAVPADFPPYWLLGTMTGLNYLGTSGNLRSEIFMSVFATGAGDPTVEGGAVPFPAASRIDPLVDYMSALRPPPPPPQDLAMVEAGAAVFERERCSACHHIEMPRLNSVTNYDRTGVAMEQIAGEPMYLHGLIHTDYQHRMLSDGPPEGFPDAGVADPRADAIERLMFDQGLFLRLSAGYREDDLHGLWATAPYLHNGSVPTLDALLRPAAERPTTFMRGDFLVDTTVIANGNGGHEFGVTISEADRAALVVYLLSL